MAGGDGGGGGDTEGLACKWWAVDSGMTANVFYQSFILKVRSK